MSEKNYDPQMHTAEHILNQTMVRMFGTSRSFSNHLERKKSKCDYHFTRPLTEQELAALEDKVNEIIAKNIPISEEFLPRAEAQSRFNLSRLPEEAGDEIRIVKVGSYDSCPCIGPHVANTSEIGQLRILSSDYTDGVLRIRFKLERPE
ncbi:MAG TPA: hypothetical protein VMW01_02230 [Williamwhitmania sp.]|nr:hypothetical protein [Williamwhitmania sp.]